MTVCVGVTVSENDVLGTLDLDVVGLIVRVEDQDIDALFDGV